MIALEDPQLLWGLLGQCLAGNLLMAVMWELKLKIMQIFRMSMFLFWIMVYSRRIQKIHHLYSCLSCWHMLAVYYPYTYCLSTCTTSMKRVWHSTSTTLSWQYLPQQFRVSSTHAYTLFSPKNCNITWTCGIMQAMCKDLQDISVKRKYHCKLFEINTFLF